MTVLKQKFNKNNELICELIQLENGKRKQVFYFDKEIKTTQEDLAASDINNIMKKYHKTGILPQTQQKVAQYLDVSEVPSLEEAHQVITSAQELFMELPADIRKLIDNDPKKLPDLLQSGKYDSILEDYGIIEKRQEVVSSLSGETAQSAESSQDASVASE